MHRNVPLCRYHVLAKALTNAHSLLDFALVCCYVRRFSENRSFVCAHFTCIIQYTPICELHIHVYVHYLTVHYSAVQYDVQRKILPDYTIRSDFHTMTTESGFACHSGCHDGTRTSSTTRHDRGHYPNAAPRPASVSESPRRPTASAHLPRPLQHQAPRRLRHVLRARRL